MILTLRGQEIRHNREPRSIEWMITYRIGGIPQTNYCFTSTLGELISWATDRADNATIVVKPVV